MENFRLKVFRVVAAHLNFSRAAEELLLTQPAVTQQIKALENEYGTPLFDRTGGHIVLTPSGKVLLPYRVSNLAFGGPMKNRLFILASHTLYAVFLNRRGVQWP